MASERQPLLSLQKPAKPLSQSLSEVCLVRKSDKRRGSAVQLNYDTFGDRQHPAVLLVMGLTSQKVRFPVSFCQRLASEGFFVVRFDNRDMGRSAKMTESRYHRAEAIGRVLLVGFFRILKERARPGLAIWFFFAVRSWQRGRLHHRRVKFLFWLAALWVASWYRPKVPYTVVDMADDALELLDALKIPKAHLVGYSMGGMISQHIAHHSPERVLSLSLVSTCSPNARLMVSPGLWTFLVMAAQGGLSYVPGAPTQSRIQGTTRLWMYVSAPGQDEAQRELAEQEHSRNSQDIDAFLRQVLCIMDFCGGDLHWAAPKATGGRFATVVIHGLIDNLLPVGHAFDLAKRMSCKCVVLPSISHDSFPAGQDDVLEELKSHLCKSI